VFTIVPGLLMSMKTEDTHLAIFDLTEGGKLSKPVRDALPATRRRRTTRLSIGKNSVGSRNANAKNRFQKAGRALRGRFFVEEVNVNGRSLPDLKRELNARISERRTGRLSCTAGGPAEKQRKQSDLLRA